MCREKWTLYNTTKAWKRKVYMQVKIRWVIQKKDDVHAVQDSVAGIFRLGFRWWVLFNW